jgi:hypothetical protein
VCVYVCVCMCVCNRERDGMRKRKGQNEKMLNDRAKMIGTYS